MATKFETLIQLAGLSRVASYAASMTDASAANGWKITKTAWECVSYSQEDAVAYWMSVAEEDLEEAMSEIELALAWVGKTVADVAHRMS